MLEQIRIKLAAVPFVPFTVHLSDGRTLRVGHPDFVWLPKPGIFFYYHDDPGAGESINPLHIVSVRKEQPGAVQAA